MWWTAIAPDALHTATSFKIAYNAPHSHQWMATFSLTSILGIGAIATTASYASDGREKIATFLFLRTLVYRCGWDHF
ncbi:MAG: hypothetical protein V7L20_21805 [Nostoc sp.]|uniref:hypothetical protein n=1 Tax=Nostoc sp. TaxID=1180 RepID=UPI002FF6FBC7